MEMLQFQAQTCGASSWTCICLLTLLGTQADPDGKISILRAHSISNSKQETICIHLPHSKQFRRQLFCCTVVWFKHPILTFPLAVLHPCLKHQLATATVTSRSTPTSNMPMSVTRDAKSIDTCRYLLFCLE